MGWIDWRSQATHLRCCHLVCSRSFTLSTRTTSMSTRSVGRLIHGLSPPLCPTELVCSSTTSPVPSRPDSASLKTWQLTQWATTTNSRSRSHMDRTPLKTQPAQDLMSAAGPSRSSSQIWTFSILRELPSPPPAPSPCRRTQSLLGPRSPVSPRWPCSMAKPADGVLLRRRRFQPRWSIGRLQRASLPKDRQPEGDQPEVLVQGRRTETEKCHGSNG